MLTQQEIAKHLDLTQGAVSGWMGKLGLDWNAASIDEIRVAYIRSLRDQAAGHKSGDGMDLVAERVLTERVDRELKQLQLAEKRGQLINIEQLEPALAQQFSAFRAELLSTADKMKSELDALYGVDVDVSVLNAHVYKAMEQLARYDASGAGHAMPAGGDAAAAGAVDDDGVVAAASRH